MGAFGWEVVGSVAGVVAAAAAVVFGVIPVLKDRRKGLALAGDPPLDSGGPGGVATIGLAEPAPELPASGPLAAGEVPREPPGFVPRPELLAELDAGRVGGGVLVVLAVTGMRGVGKTQLAAAFARARRDEGWRLVAWIDAETEAGLLTGLAETAAVIGLKADDAQGAGRAVRHWLEADSDRCLLVFDNATSPDLIEPYVPSGGRATILITSNQQAMANLGTPVPVGVFTDEQATRFLAGRTRLADPAGAAGLAAELGYLPIALAQAAAVIAGQQLDYATYLDRLRRLPVADLLGPVAASNYKHGTAAAILLALDAARAADQAGTSTGIMDLLSVLSPDGVPRALVRAAGQDGRLGADSLTADLVDAALGRLASVSLATFSLDGTAVTVHRLVLRVIRDQHAAAGTLAGLCGRVADLLDRQAATVYEGLHEDRAAARNLAGQILALRGSAASCTGTHDLDARLLRLRWWAVSLLNRLGDSAALAISVGEGLLADHERVLGPDHPDTLASRDNLAIAYQAAGRTADAITLHQQALTGRERVLGPDHPDTLASMNNLAIAHQAAGRTADAITLHQQALTGRERVLGPDHPDTLKSRSNLAIAYQAAGRTADAITLHQQALTGRERVLRPDHPDTLASMNNLAIAYQAAGRTADAITLHQQALTGRERVLGPDHPDTLKSRSNLAIAHQAAGRTTDAITLHQQALDARERILGPDHPDTLKSRSNLAIAHQAAGRTTDAIWGASFFPDCGSL